MVLIDRDKTFKNNIKKIKKISIGTRAQECMLALGPCLRTLSDPRTDKQ